MSRFEIGEQDFLLDGRPYQIVSGACTTSEFIQNSGRIGLRKPDSWGSTR